ncbi:hypothetical protein VKT23_009713 [Stygiomarasmius scandens]|uniref:Annexin n=1 Tax=Marasmiellus scandens TaxID=2682957 RepID=A0ABR1JHV7_9AGAR
MSYYPNAYPGSHSGGQNYDQNWGYQMPNPGAPPPIPNHSYPGAPPAFPAHPQQAPLMPQFPQFPQAFQGPPPPFPAEVAHQAQSQSHSIYPVPNHPGYHPSYDRPPPSNPPYHPSYTNPGNPATPAPYGVSQGGYQYTQSFPYGHQQPSQPQGTPQYGHQFYYLGTPIPSPHTATNYLSVPGYDANAEAEKIRKVTKGFGTDEDTVISAIAPLSALQVAALGAAFKASVGETLTDKLGYETSGWFKVALRGITLGPLAYDVELLNEAIKGAGTDEQLLTELVVDRTPEDIQLLKAAYRERYGKDLENEVQGEFSGKTKRLFTMTLSSNRPPDNAPVDHALVEKDVKTLYDAGQGKIGTDEIAFCDVLVNRSRPHLGVLCEAYEKKYKKLSKVIKSEFSGQLRDTLLYIVDGAKAPKDKSKKDHKGHKEPANAETWGIMRDVKLLEKSMKGAGTKDKELVRRIVRFHWSQTRFRVIKHTYESKYGKTLEDRVKGETSGDYRKLLLAVIRASG